MPVPQENLLFVEQASCLFLRMVQDVRSNCPNAPKCDRIAVMPPSAIEFPSCAPARRGLKTPVS
ncbi:hypothetical protein QUB19_17910 [Microcoleus sp. B4-C5]|uniref:hypothetical protein n=1 Tax=unclassified Microcoleus TaxID=2642155 RepID=UPI002FD173A5